MKRYLPFLIALLVLGAPLCSYAAAAIDPVTGDGTPQISPGPTVSVVNAGAFGHYGDLVLVVINNILVPILFTIAFLVFLWGVFNYFIVGGADEDKRKEGRQFILWGLIGFVVMFSLWGLVNILSNTLGLGGYARPDYQTL